MTDPFTLLTFPAKEREAISKDRPWFVWCPGILGGGEPRVGHASQMQAVAEATRMSKEFPGRVFAIGYITGVVACLKPEFVEWEDRPF